MSLFLKLLAAGLLALLIALGLKTTAPTEHVPTNLPANSAPADGEQDSGVG